MRIRFAAAVTMLALCGCGSNPGAGDGGQAIQEGTGGISDGGAENPGTAATGNDGGELNEGVEGGGEQTGTGGP